MPTCPTCRSQYPAGTRVCATDGEGLLPDEAFLGVDPDLQPGEKVGEYEIEHLLGRGGFGTVYKGVHPLIGKRVAVKVLNREYSSSPEIVSRFISEARAVNQIQHRNIIDIFSFGGLPDGRQYFVMEYLEGMPLDAYLDRRGSLPVEEVIAILRPIARALDAAHAQGIAHRDLKPENIFLAFTEDGRPDPKLLDFGIAKLLGDNTSGHKTGTGMPIGTPHYMSPEQCRGKDVDHRTDIYSFGIVVFELLTGSRPFDAEQMMDLMLQHLNDAPPPPSSRNTNLRPGLNAPVRAMMAKNPSDRPASVSAALEQFAAAAKAAGYETEVLSFNPATIEDFPRTEPQPPAFGVLHTPSAMAHTLPAEAVSSPHTQPTLPAHEHRKRAPVVGMMAFGLVLLGGGLFAITTLAGSGSNAGGSADTVHAGTPERSPSPAADSASVPAAESPQSAQGPPAPASAAPEPALPDSVELTVQSNPDVVDVYLGDARIGDSSQPIELERSETPVQLVLKAPGYLPKRVEVVPKANNVVTATLARRPAPKRAATPAKKKPKKESEIEF